MSRYTVEFHKPPLGKRPEGFDTVDMAPAVSELVSPVLHSKVLFISQIDQAIVASPAISVDDAVEADSSTNDGLQCGFGAVRDDFGVDSAFSLKDAENRGLAGSASTPFAFDPLAAKVGFIDLDFTCKRRFMFTELGNSCPDEMKITVDGVAVEASEGSCLTGVQIEDETSCQLPELGLGNFCTENILVFHWLA